MQEKLKLIQFNSTLQSLSLTEWTHCMADWQLLLLERMFLINTVSFVCNCVSVWDVYNVSETSIKLPGSGFQKLESVTSLSWAWLRAPNVSSGALYKWSAVLTTALRWTVHERVIFVFAASAHIKEPALQAAAAQLLELMMIMIRDGLWHGIIYTPYWGWYTPYWR